jgi:hypothetical protein
VRSVTGHRGQVLIAAVAIVTAVAAVALWYVFGRDDHQTEQADPAMATRAQQVMPFELDHVTHTFTKTTDGGVERVVVKDSGDTRNLALIRSHLRTEADEFGRGNYSDPAKIHGMDMPGVEELERGAARVEVVFAEIPGGAQITYSSGEPALVVALHAWFDRQGSDHSAPGMGG